MVIKYQISPYDYAGNLEVKIWEAQSDGAGAEVYTEVLAPPHALARTITVNGLDTVAHIVRLYRQADNYKLHEYNVEPTLEAMVFDPIYFKIGDGGANTPAAGSAQYDNAILQGLAENQYTIHRNNYGYLFFNEHVTNNPGTGGFVLLAPDVFGDNEEFVVQMQQQVANNTINDSVVGKWFAGFVDVSANLSFDSSHLRKLVRFEGVFTYEFPALGAVPMHYIFCFQNFGVGNGKVKFSNAPLLWGNTTKTEIDINEKCQAAFVFDGANWNVVYLIATQEAVVPVTPPGTVMGVGQIDIGDVVAGDPSYAVQHNLAIAGDYFVLLSVRSKTAANYFRNNLLGQIPWHWDEADKPNRFYITPQEIKGEAQDIMIYWQIIKL